MKNLKIRVANEAESKEAQELFFKLGYYWAYKNLGKKLLLSKKDVYLFAESGGTLGTGTHQDEVFFNNWRGKEITLQELKDLVVLKRNDESDASHVNENTGEFYRIINGAWHVLNEKWEPSRRNQLWIRDKTKPIIDKLVDLPEFKHDVVNHPSHYCSHPSGIECIEITRHHDFAIGNAIKYLWRAGLKDSDNEIQDLEKAIFYIQDKIEQLKNK